MSYLRAGRGGENRRSVFYTGNNLSGGGGGGSGGGGAEDWELVDAPAKDFPEHKNPSDTHRSMFTPSYSQSVCLSSSCFYYAFVSSAKIGIILLEEKRESLKRES